MNSLLQSIRSLWRQRAFSALVIAIMALGVGANAAVFAIVNAVLLQKLPFNDTEQLVMVTEAAQTLDTGLASPNAFLEWRDRNPPFSRMAAFMWWEGSGEDPTLMVTAGKDFFDVLGAKPILGRTFSDEEIRGGSNSAVILSLYNTGEKRVAYYRSLMQSIASLPEVASVGGMRYFPMHARLWTATIQTRENPERKTVYTNRVAGDYFQAMGIPLIAGRLPTPQEIWEGGKGLLVNQSAARTLFPGGTAVGKQIGSDGNFREVIGVVGDVRQAGLGRPPGPEIYALTGENRTTINGLVTYWVTQRTAEIGIRIALGASHMNVLGLALGQGFRSALTGMGIGLAMSLALARLISFLLYGLPAFDPVTFVLAPTVLLFVTMSAAFLPAFRAIRINPVEAIRSE